MKRVFLFLVTNLAVLVVASVVLRLLGVEGYLTQRGVDVDLRSLLIFCAVFGMAGSFISLLLSKSMAMRTVGAQVIKEPRGTGGAVAGRDGAPPGAGRRHRHARRRRLRGPDAERLRHRRAQEQGAGRGLHRPAPAHEAATRSRPCSATRSATSRTATW